MHSVPRCLQRGLSLPAAVAHQPGVETILPQSWCGTRPGRTHTRLPAHVIVPEGAVASKVEAIEMYAPPTSCSLWATSVRASQALRTRARANRRNPRASVADTRVNAVQGTACDGVDRAWPAAGCALAPVGWRIDQWQSAIAAAALARHAGSSRWPIRPVPPIPSNRCAWVNGVRAFVPDTICDGLPPWSARSFAHHARASRRGVDRRGRRNHRGDAPDLARMKSSCEPSSAIVLAAVIIIANDCGPAHRPDPEWRHVDLDALAVAAEPALGPPSLSMPGAASKRQGVRHSGKVVPVDDGGRAAFGRLHVSRSALTGVITIEWGCCRYTRIAGCSSSSSSKVPAGPQLRTVLGSAKRIGAHSTISNCQVAACPMRIWKLLIDPGPDPQP